MGCAEKLLKNITLVLLGILKVGVAVAIIVIVSVDLQDMTWNQEEWYYYTWNGTCWMSTTTDSYSLCAYAYAVAGFSILLSLTIGLLLCCTCNMCGLGGVLEILVSALGTAWWVAAAIVFNKYGKQANDANVPGEDPRTAVVILCWVNVIFFGLTLLIEIIAAVACMNNCCRGKKDKAEKKAAAVPKDPEMAAPAVVKAEGK